MARRRAPNQSRKNRLSPVMVAAIVLVVVVLVASFALQGLIGVSPANRRNQVDFVSNDFSGRLVHLSDYRGKPVLVNLWASWCPPCRAEMPDLIKYYNAHQAEGLVLLAVDTSDQASPAQQFVREQQMPFPVLFDPSGAVQQVFGANGLPSTYLIDRNGTLRFTHTGQISPAILEQRVTPLLPQ